MSKPSAPSPAKEPARELPEAPGESLQPQNPFPIVGIGASAGGLEAFTQLLSGLPKNPGMAFVLVQHLDPSHESQLTHLLANVTAMPVREVKDGMLIKPDHVFVIPPNVNLSLAKGKLKLTPRDETCVPHLPVDFLFRSLAKEQQSWAIGVILSGTGSDGALGLKEIKDAGGITFAQDEKSAKFSSMPLRAGNVDFILPPGKIAQELIRIGHDPYMILPPKTENEEKQLENARHFRRILAIVRSHTNADLSQYRDATIKRRIQRRMVVNTRYTLADYIKLLEKDGAEVKALFDDMLINVTRFFRDAELFEMLKAEVFPEILKTSPRVIRVWVAACSTGQEAYSMAIALLEFLEHKSNPPAIQIFGTDINESVAIEKARRGVYPESIRDEVSPERLERYFTREEKGYRVNKMIRDLCIFAKQNINSDPPFSRMNLISCRNLLIYFTPELQRRVVSTFHYALNQNGFLVLGSSETVGANADMFEVLDRKYKIFSKKGMATRPFSHFSAEDLKAGTVTSAHTNPPHAPGVTDFQKEADRFLLGRYSPAAVLINNSLEVLQFRGRTGPSLEQPPGPASFSLLKMARDNLPLELGKIIRKARQQNSPARSSTYLQGNETVRKINLEAVPLKLAGTGEQCFLILFEEIGNEIAVSERARARKREIADLKKPASEKDRELQQLRRDLADAREYLQSVIEQHDASNEELKCANEEVLSSNEELQSTNEQLGTAKEELQSTNEELATLNEELNTRNGELTQLNVDLKGAHENLLDYVTAVVETVRGPFLVLSADAMIHKANEAFYKTFQVSAGEIENRPIFELDNRQWDTPQLRQLLAEISSGKSVLKGFEVTHHFPKIGRRSLMLNARRLEQKPPVRPMILLSIEDITEFKQIEEMNQWMAAVVTSSDDGIISKDLNGKIISCNEGAARLFGYPPEELTGQPVTILIPPGLQNEEVKIIERIRKGERIEQFETVRRCKDGRLIDVSLTVSPVKDATGKIIGASKIARDITIRKQSEKNLAASLEREKSAREVAETANHAKDDFLAALSHELRTPLNPVLLLASDAVKNRDLPPAVRADFEIIRKNIEMEARLIDDLLDLTRITLGKLVPDRQTIDAHAVLQNAIATSQAELDGKKIELILKLHAQPALVHADEARLQQIFWNVFKNAVKFTPDAGKIVVETFTADDDKKLCVKITDTGIGMTPEELKRIFAPFSQGDHNHTHQFGGLGLGLAISQRLIGFHSGLIRAASDGPGRGSTFIVELPLALPENDQPPAAKDSVPDNSTGKKNASEIRILLVEDHEPTRNALTRLLVRRKYKVSIAASLAEARELSEKEKFDLVISDVGLPDGSGYALMTELRDRHGLKGIALTGYGMERDVTHSLSVGFVAHLTKPVNIQTLEKTLAALNF
jgi:two-component system CheB/CheR fusion protein